MARPENRRSQSRPGEGRRGGAPAPAAAKKRADSREPPHVHVHAEEEAPLVFSRHAAREVDQLATEEFGIPSILLMENAAASLVEAAWELLEEVAGASVVIFAGPGNNGGDGLAAARLLTNVGARARVILAADPEKCTGDASVQLNIVQKMGIEVTVAPDESAVAACRARLERDGDPDLVIDALLGTGLSSAVREPVAGLIRVINAMYEREVPVLSADIPSGLDADTGAPLGPPDAPAVRADLTVSFAGVKRGFLALGARPYVGELAIGDIGVPVALLRRLGESLDHPAHPGDDLPHPPVGPR